MSDEQQPGCCRLANEPMVNLHTYDKYKYKCCMVKYTLCLCCNQRCLLRTLRQLLVVAVAVVMVLLLGLYTV